MSLGGRHLGTISKAVFKKEHYIALVGMFRLYEHPWGMLTRYLFAKGEYPCTINIKTPLGKVKIKLYSHHDLLTVNEIFCRGDYSAPEPLRSVVDFGSNIGISALYFLTRNPYVRVNLFEPLSANIERLKENLRGYEDRYTLHPIAVGLQDGEVEFSYEPSGRYGGIHRVFPSSVRVPCRTPQSILSEILSEPGPPQIDLLKMDIEGLETQIIQSIPPLLLSRIRAIYAEIVDTPPQLSGFSRERYGLIVRWRREAPQAETLLPLTQWGMMAYAILSLTSMALMNIGAGLLLLGLLFDQGGPRRFFSEFRDVLRRPFVWPYLLTSSLVFLACFLSLASARWYPLSFGDRTVSVHWLRDLGKMWYFFLPLVLLVGWQRLSETRRNQVIQSWISCFGLLSVLGVTQFFTGWPRAQPNPLVPGYFHPVLLLGHHLSVASIWIFPFFATLEIALSRAKISQIKISRELLFGFLTAGLLTLILGYSRTLLVGLPIGLAFWGMMRLPKKARLSLLALVLTATAALSQTSFIQRRFENKMGISDRVQLWKANFAFFETRPLFGVGFGKNQEFSGYYLQWLHPDQHTFFVGHSHNIYLEVLAGTGIFGALAWISWIVVILGLFIRGLRSRASLKFPMALLAAGLVFLINGTTQVNFWEGKVLHQIMWVVGMALMWRMVPEEQNRL